MKAIAGEGATASASMTIAPVTDGHVRVRAYYLYLERQGQSPDALEDWLKAERELRARSAEPSE